MLLGRARRGRGDRAGHPARRGRPGRGRGARAVQQRRPGAGQPDRPAGGPAADPARRGPHAPGQPAAPEPRRSEGRPRVGAPAARAARACSGSARRMLSQGVGRNAGRLQPEAEHAVPRRAAVLLVHARPRARRSTTTRPVELTIGPDLAKPLRPVWGEVEAHADRLDRLARQQAKVRFEVTAGRTRAGAGRDGPAGRTRAGGPGGAGGQGGAVLLRGRRRGVPGRPAGHAARTRGCTCCWPNWPPAGDCTAARHTPEPRAFPFAAPPDRWFVP